MSRLRILVMGALCLGFLALATLFFLDDPAARRVRPRVERPVSAAPVSAARVEPPTADDTPVRPRRVVKARRITGRVTDVDGNALAYAKITLRVAGKQFVDRTDVQGRYALEGMMKMPGGIEATATGHERRRKRVPADATSVDFTLDRKDGLVVQVLQDERPVADAHVMAFRTGGRDYRRSDGGGLAFFPWPEAGITQVSGRHGGHGVAVQAVEGPGRVELALPVGAYITGRVLDRWSNPVSGFSIQASSRRTRGPTQSFDEASGTYRYGPVAAGTLTLHAAAEGYQPAQREVTVEDGQTLSGIDIQLVASVRLVGQVYDAKTEEPIEGAHIIPAEWRSGLLAESVGAYTDAEGRYALSALPGKRTSIRVKAEGYRSVLIGGVEGPDGGEVRRDFGLTPQRTDQVPATELTGIGAVLGRHHKGIRIGRIIDGGPAADALNAGDVVVAIDGDPISGREMRRAAQAIRGEEGTDVELMVLRGGEGEPVPVVLTRGRVTVPDRHHRRN